MACAVALALSIGGLAAQTDGPDTEGGRFIVRNFEDGVLRIDRETGATSICRPDASGWACRAVPEDRTALEDEIVRLADENAELARRIGRLEDRLAANGTGDDDAPEPERGEVPLEDETESSDRNFSLDLPTDAEISRMMNAFETMMHRFLDMVRSLREDEEAGRL